MPLLLARSDDSIRRQAVVDEFVDIRFDQFAVDDPGFFRQHVAIRVALRRIEKDVPRRTPLARIARQLTVAVVRCLLAILARFRFANDWIWRSIRSKEILP